MDNTKEIIVLQSAYNKTPGQVYYIQPCINPETGDYPDCIRDVYDEKTHRMVLSESDKEDQKRGVVFLPVSKSIKVQHGTTFDLSNPLQKAQWEAIKHSSLIAESRDAKDVNGNYLVDGEKPYLSETGVVKGKYGNADLYVFRPGVAAENRNTMKELVYKATGLVLNDPAGLSGWITKCKLLEKDMSHAYSSDVKDYLLTQAEKDPKKIIELYTGSTTQIRLMLIDAMNKHIIVKRQGLLIYSDDVVLGASTDAAVTYLAQPEHNQVKQMIERETYPNLFMKKDLESATDSLGESSFADNLAKARAAKAAKAAGK